MYSVTAASRMSGVHPETLRAWERRYEAIQPCRDERGRRVYAAEDVERLRLLRRGTELGHPISRLAGLELDELRRVSGECPAVEAEADLESSADRGDLTQMVTRLLDAVGRYRADECDEVLGLAATFLEPDRLVGSVVAPAMRAVGDAWHRGEMSVAQERLLSCSARRTISSLIATYRRRVSGPVMVLATLPGERHEVGLMASALMAAAEGVDCIYLGPEIPHDDLVTAAHATGARCVGLSCVMTAPAPELIHELCDRLPEQCELWLGGCATAALEPDTLPRACTCLHEPVDLRMHARGLCNP